MKSKFLFLLFTILLSASLAHAAEKTDTKPLFHPPQTEAEKMLDHILVLDRGQGDFYNFLFQRKWKKLSKAQDFSSLFTQEFLKVWIQEDRKLAKKTCGDNIDTTQEACGMDYTLSCDDVAEDADFLYQTEASDKKHAIVNLFTLAKSKSLIKGPLYRLVNDNGLWKLDGLKCSKDVDYGRDFNYTRNIPTAAPH